MTDAMELRRPLTGKTLEKSFEISLQEIYPRKSLGDPITT